MEKRMESGAVHYEKRKEAAEKIRSAMERVHQKYGIEAEIEDTGTPESTIIVLKDEKGEVVKTMGFMNFDSIPVGGHTKPVEEVIEARLRYPDMDVEEAVRKVEEEKKG